MKLFRQFTWKSLKANRTRTLVTMIGIILSVALLTAVAAGAYSGQQYMIETTQVLDGCYHAYGTHLSADDLVLRVAHQCVSEGGLTGTVRSHQDMGLTSIHCQIDAVENLLLLDLHLKILDIQ